MGGSASESPSKRTRRTKKQSTPRNLTPTSPGNSVDNTKMDLLLDMSSRMQAMEEYVSQHSQHTLTGNQGSIPERNSVHARLDNAAAPSCTGAAADGWDRSSTIAPRVTDELVPEMVRRKLARCLRRTPLLVETCTDESETVKEPAPRRKKAKAHKSGKIRTAKSTVIKRITWPHELVYTSGGKPVTYELISLPQFVAGYLSVLDTKKSGERKVMLKHLKELMADVSTTYELTTGVAATA